MKQRLLRAAVIIVVLATLFWASGYFGLTPQQSAAGRLAASGTIEAEEYRVTAQIGGRIEALQADEGDEVKAGQVLAHLDEALLRAELKKVQAARAVAQAQLDLVKAGARAEDIRKAEMAVKAAVTARDGARVAWEDAQLARDKPQDLDLRITTARTQLAVAEARLAQASAGTGGAQAQYDLWAIMNEMVSSPQSFCVTLPNGRQVCQEYSAPRQYVDDASYQWNLSAQQLAGAWDAVSLATASRDLARANLNALLSQRANPLAANLQVNAAWASYQAAEAALKEAQAALEMARAGATTPQVRMAQAGVAQAEAAVQAIQVQLDKLTLRSPTNGLITVRGAEEGEMAVPGVSLFTVANLDRVKLTVYIPEAQIARVKVGQRVSVSVDSFPGRTFEGQVTYISPQAEFTPRTVQTQEERAKTVFAIKVTIANADNALKPGMPADAVIEEGG